MMRRALLVAVAGWLAGTTADASQLQGVVRKVDIARSRISLTTVNRTRTYLVAPNVAVIGQGEGNVMQAGGARAGGLRAAAWDDVWAGPALEGAATDIGIRRRVEGTQGLARGAIGWRSHLTPTPSTLDYSTCEGPTVWQTPRWSEVWFLDAFAGTMAQLLCALEDRAEPEISGRDNLQTMALVDACYLSAKEHRAVELREVLVP